MKEFGTFPKPPEDLLNPAQRHYYNNGVFKGQKILRRYEALVRDGGRCVVCKTKSFLTIDHIVPRAIVKTLGIQSLGYPNWQIMCEECNKEKGTQIITYRLDFEKLYAITKYVELCIRNHKKIQTIKEQDEVLIYDKERRTFQRAI